MCFLMFSVALDMYVPPLSILSFFVNVSLTLASHKNVTLYTFTVINLHSYIAFSFTTDKF